MAALQALAHESFPAACFAHQKDGAFLTLFQDLLFFVLHKPSHPFLPSAREPAIIIADSQKGMQHGTENHRRIIS